METTTEGVVKFVKGTWSSNQISWEDIAATLTGGTGDGLMLLIGALFLVLALAFTLIFIAKRYKNNVFAKAEAAFGKHAVSSINTNSGSHSKRNTFVFLIMGAASLLIGATLCLVSANHSGAFANNDNGTGNPEIQLSINDIIGTVEENGEVTLSEGTLVNYGSEDAIVSSTKLQFADGNTTDCTWTFVSGNTPLYNGKATAEGQEYQLAQTLVVNKNGGQVPVKLKIAGLNADTSKSLVGKNVVKLSYYGTMKASQDYKDKAKAQIDTDAQSAKDAIDNTSYLTDEEKTKAKEDIDKYAEDAKNKIDEAETTSEVDDAKEEFSHNCVEELSDITNKHLDTEKQSTDNKIDSISGLTDQDKARYKETINNIYVEYHEKIANATSFEEIIQYYTEAVQKFNQTITEATALGQEKIKAKEEIDDAYDKTIEDIDNKKNITDEEKEKYKKEAEEEREKSKDAVDDSTNKEDVDKAVEDAEKKAKEISDEVAEKENAGKWTVLFELNGHGSAVASQEVKYGYEAKEPTPAPEATGYTFVGWFKDKELNTPWLFNSDKVGVDVESNTCTQTIYAKWAPKTTTVNLSAEEATTKGTTSVVVTYGAPMPTITIPTKTGTDFMGYLDSDSKTYYLSDGTSACNWDKDIAECTLTAAWGIRMYDVNFETNGHGQQPQKQQVRVNGKATNPGNLEANGYIFGGWKTSSSLETTFDFDNTLITKDTTIYAKWTECTTNVTFDKKGGTGGTDSVTATYDKNLDTIDIPSKSGYTFSGYYTEEGGQGTKYITNDDGKGVGIKEWDITDSTKTLYAAWTANTYTITFDFNDATQQGQPTSANVAFGEELPEITTTPTRTGCTFTGFYDQKTGGNQIYDADGKAKLEKWATADDVTLYAHWEGRETTITFDANGGSGVDPTTLNATVSQDMPTGIKTLPTKENETFLGYYDEQTGGTQYYACDGVSSHVWDKDVDTATLYAHYGTIDCVVSFDMNGHGTQVAAQNLTKGSKVTKPETPIENGWAFGGWFTTQACTEGTDWKFETTISGGMILYAKWTEKVDPQLTVADPTNKIADLEIETSKTVTLSTLSTGLITATPGSTAGETGVVTASLTDKSCEITGTTAGNGAYVTFTIAETETYKAATVNYAIDTVSKHKRTLTLADKEGNSITNDGDLSVPYFSDGYAITASYTGSGSAGAGESNNKVQWTSSSKNLAVSYDEASVDYKNECTLIGITPESTKYTLTAKLEATDKFEAATASVGVMVTSRGRDVSIAADKYGKVDLEDATKVTTEIDYSTVLTETHHGYINDPDASNKATWTLLTGSDVVTMSDVTSNENTTQGLTNDTENLSSNDEGKASQDDKKFTSAKKFKALKKGTATFKITIPAGDSQKYTAYEQIYTINVDLHDPTSGIKLTHNPIDVTCYTTEANQLTFTAESGMPQEEVKISSASIKLGESACEAKVASVAVDTDTSKANITAGGCGANLTPTVTLVTTETTSYKSVEITFGVNLKQNTSRTAKINDGAGLKLFTQNTTASTAEAKLQDSLVVSPTEKYTFSLAEDSTVTSNSIAAIQTPAAEQKASVAKIKAVAGGTTNLYVTIEDNNKSTDTEQTPGFATVKANIAINVDNWEYSFNGTNATVTKYVGAENVTTKDVEIPGSVTFVSANNGLEEETTYQVTKIGEGTNPIFSKDHYCAKIKIEDGATSLSTIAASAFKETTDNFLTSVDLTNATNLSTIGASAFMGATNLTTFTFPVGASAGTTLGDNSFEGDTSLATITFPTGCNLTSVGNSAFKGCTAITTLDFKAASKVKTLGTSAFENCTGMTSCDFSGTAATSTSLTNIGTSAFVGCSALEKIYFNYTSLTAIGDSNFKGCAEITEAQFKNCSSLASVADNAFNGCTKLASFYATDSKNISSISDSAFTDTALDSTKTDYVGGYDKDNLYLLTVDKNDVDTSVNIHSTTLAMVDNAFKDCTGVKYIRVGEKDATASSAITLKVSPNAFSGCTALESYVVKAVGDNDKVDYSKGNKPFTSCGANTAKSGQGIHVYEKPVLLFAGGTNTKTAAASQGLGQESIYEIFAYQNLSGVSECTANNYYCMNEDITRSGLVSVSGTSVVDLNGFTFKRTTGESDDANAFLMTSSSINFTLLDSNDSGGQITGVASRTDFGGAIAVGNDKQTSKSSSFNMYSGIITGNTSSYSGLNNSYGAGVSLYDNCNGSTFNMYGGQITKNGASHGGGVAVFCYTGETKYFNMFGGVIGDKTITAPTSTNCANYTKEAATAWSPCGAGVYLYGKSVWTQTDGKPIMNMYGGSICGNFGAHSDNSYGGGVYQDKGVFNGYGGEIINNGHSYSSSSGSGKDYYKNDGTANLNGVTIGDKNF